MPHVENVETRGNCSTTGLLLNRSHLLVAAVPADEDLDGVLGDRGWSWGLCLTHLCKKVKPCDFILSVVNFSRHSTVADRLGSSGIWVALSVAHGKSSLRR